MYIRTRKGKLSENTVILDGRTGEYLGYYQEYYQEEEHMGWFFFSTRMGMSEKYRYLESLHLDVQRVVDEEYRKRRNNENRENKRALD